MLQYMFSAHLQIYRTPHRIGEYPSQSTDLSPSRMANFSPINSNNTTPKKVKPVKNEKDIAGQKGIQIYIKIIFSIFNFCIFLFNGYLFHFIITLINQLNIS